MNDILPYVGAFPPGQFLLHKPNRESKYDDVLQSVLNDDNNGQATGILYFEKILTCICI